MKKRGIGFALIFCVAGFAQKFEIVDIHSRPPNSILAMRSGFAEGKYELRNATMLDLIRTAWNVDADKVQGGPGWLEMDRFDVVGMAEPGSTREALRAGLREVLVDRFGLAAKVALRDLPAYGIVVGKKPLLRVAEGKAASGCQLAGESAGTPRTKAGDLVDVACTNVTMAQFAASLPGLRGESGYLFEYPVTDRTGLKGGWDFRLQWTMRARGMERQPEGTPVVLQDAFEKQLGLRLELVPVATQVVVVEKVNRRPTANLPGVSEKLAPPAMEFEVATVKVAGKDDPEGSHVAIQKGGPVRISMTLQGLIQEAWGSLAPERIIGLPNGSGLKATQFSITAKAPATTLDAGPAVFSGIDIDAMRAMLRALLVERFGLVSHEEDRQVSGYALVAGKVKLQRAVTGNRPGCREGPGADGKDMRLTNPLVSRLVTCRNVTMAEFARELRNIAGEYLEAFPPVVDATGLEGRYDVTVGFSRRGAIQNAVRRGPDGEIITVDPNGAMSIFEAVQGQLGLRLESRKVMAPVVVIDRVAEMPTGN